MAVSARKDITRGRDTRGIRGVEGLQNDRLGLVILRRRLLTVPRARVTRDPFVWGFFLSAPPDEEPWRLYPRFSDPRRLAMTPWPALW